MICHMGDGSFIHVYVGGVAGDSVKTENLRCVEQVLGRSPVHLLPSWTIYTDKNTTYYWNMETATSIMWRTILLTTRNGHGQSGWSPIGCEGLYFHAVQKLGIGKCTLWLVKVSRKFEHHMSTPHYFSLPLILWVTITHIISATCSSLVIQNTWKVWTTWICTEKQCQPASLAG